MVVAAEKRFAAICLDGARIWRPKFDGVPGRGIDRYLYGVGHFGDEGSGTRVCYTGACGGAREELHRGNAVSPRKGVRDEKSCAGSWNQPGWIHRAAGWVGGFPVHAKGLLDGGIF